MEPPCPGLGTAEPPLVCVAVCPAGIVIEDRCWAEAGGGIMGAISRQELDPREKGE